MRSPSKTISTQTVLVLCWLLGCSLLAGCSYLSSPHQTRLPPEFTSESIAARLLATVTLDQVDEPVKPAGPQKIAVLLPPSPGPPELSQDANPLKNPESTSLHQVFSLPQAIAFGLSNNPKLLAALAGIERARGQEQVAFAPFLPEFDLLTHGGVTSGPLAPAGAGPTGNLLPTSDQTHSYLQTEVQLQWTIYDFGRTRGRYQQAEARARIAELQSGRAEQTVGFDVAAAYLLTLRAEAVRRIQEEAIRRDEATLRDTRSRRDAGVAQKDDVLRAEVQLAGPAPCRKTWIWPAKRSYLPWPD